MTPFSEFEDLELSGHEVRLHEKQYNLSIIVGNLLRAKNWTRRFLAERMGVLESSLSRMMSVSNSNLTLETVAKMEEALETDLLLTPQQFEHKYFTDREYRLGLKERAAKRLSLRLAGMPTEHETYTATITEDVKSASKITLETVRKTLPTRSARFSTAVANYE